MQDLPEAFRKGFYMTRAACQGNGCFLIYSNSNIWGRWWGGDFSLKRKLPFFLFQSVTNSTPGNSLQSCSPPQRPQDPTPNPTPAGELRTRESGATKKQNRDSRTNMHFGERTARTEVLLVLRSVCLFVRF